jgi:hypothetical protein
MRVSFWGRLAAAVTNYIKELLSQNQPERIASLVVSSIESSKQ